MRALLFLQDKPWVPKLSTVEPQGHLCGRHSLAPKRKPTATGMASSLSRKPQLEMGSAFSQSLLCSADTASNRERLAGLVSKRFFSASTMGLSQLCCLKEAGSVGWVHEDRLNHVARAMSSCLDLVTEGCDRMSACNSVDDENAAR